MLKRKTKIQGGATNNYINFPKMWIELLRSAKGKEVETVLDLKNNQIVIKFEKK